MQFHCYVVCSPFNGYDLGGDRIQISQCRFKQTITYACEVPRQEQAIV
ncbi:hypothetical protein [Anabaena azotica]|uniref:Uncharacterized protein n=1 Tax=Anabaena azotica FACHB-119 TaxID=947527 RepID=A0ABR8D0I3_9NOST|nr:hypothetical protein [Anabaena azotica]MBD2500658.1 hypothetical protein [Anabaena azotica FACHB-119]